MGSPAVRSGLALVGPWLLAAGCAATPGGVGDFAPPPPPASEEPDPSLPSGRELVERFVDVTSVRSLAEETSSLYLLGRVAFSEFGEPGRFESWSARPDRKLVRMQVRNLGEIRIGYDGGLGWTMHPVMGPVVMDGCELLQMRAQATYDALLKPAELYESVDTIARETFEGHDCYRVRCVLRPAPGMDPVDSAAFRTSYEYYDAESGLLRGTVSTSSSPVGPTLVTKELSEYRSFDGVRLPSRSVQRVPGSWLAITIERVDRDVVRDDVFVLPGPIAELAAAGSGARP